MTTKKKKQHWVWVARDLSGEVYCVNKKPTRQDNIYDNDKGLIQLPESWFPEVTFESGPKRVPLGYTSA